jgi:CRP/FNR family cyclic AMP-dependent transcriptional regulator
VGGCNVPGRSRPSRLPFATMPRTSAKEIDLSQIWLFAACSARDLRKVRSSLDEIHVDAGEILCEEGATGHEFFLIVSGTAAVKRKGRKVATLGPGQWFGELALLDRQPRSATIVAETDMDLLVLEQRHFLGLLDTMPSLSRKMLAAMASRLREADKLAFPG